MPKIPIRMRQSTHKVRMVRVPAGSATVPTLAQQDVSGQSVATSSSDMLAGQKRILEEQRRNWDETIKLRNVLDERLKVLFQAVGLLGPIVSAVGLTQLSVLEQASSSVFWIVLFAALICYAATLFLALAAFDNNLALRSNPIDYKLKDIRSNYYNKDEIDVLEALIEEYSQKNKTNQKLLEQSQSYFKAARRFFYLVLVALFLGMVLTITRQSIKNTATNANPIVLTTDQLTSSTPSSSNSPSLTLTVTFTSTPTQTFIPTQQAPPTATK